MKSNCMAIVMAAGVAMAASVAMASTPLAASGQDRGDQAREEGARLFEAECASCHTEGGDERTPGTGLLNQLSPRAIVASLEDGVMRAEGAALSPQQRILVAEYLTRRAYADESLPASAYCADAGWLPLDVRTVSWMGFGGNLAGTGFQPPGRAGLDAADVPALALRWAFAFPDAGQVRTSPAVVDDHVVVGGPFGDVLALDIATGCVRWRFEADAGVRGAILVGEGPEGRPTAWFMDSRTTVYALDVSSGALLWRHRAGWHPASYGTGTPALHDGRLFVPVSSLEVVLAGDPGYECCTSSGAVAALDALTGEVLWYHRIIPGYAEEAGENGVGTPRWAPSGAAVWSSPTVDPGRGLVYAGTGENLTRPVTANSDAIVALDMETGDLAWSFQATPEDAFNMACTQIRDRENCPDPPGPDLDFGMAPMLVTRSDGREVLVAGQKSGTVWALDPDDGGAVLWSAQVGKGSALGGIHWGMASDGRYAYAPNADRNAVIVDVNPDQEPAPGLYALDLMNGEVVWSAPSPEDGCEGKERCYAANSAAVTAIEGVVFAGGLDGIIRAHSSADGRVVWEFDTTDVESTNGVPGRGGAIDGPGPVVAGGMLFVNSGYGTFDQMPGNLLLAFGVRGDPTGSGAGASGRRGPDGTDSRP